MKSVELVFQEFRYEVLTILTGEEGETNFETILTKAAKQMKRPKEDIDTSHGLVKAVYDLTEHDLIEKSGPDSYQIVARGTNVLEIMSALKDIERTGLSKPYTVETIQGLATIPMSIYRLKTRVSAGENLETVAEILKDAGLITITESPMETHRILELTRRGEDAIRVIGLIEAELRRRGPQKQRKIRIL